MKILLLTNNDVASLVACNLLIPRIIDHQVFIGMSTKVGININPPQELVELALHEKSKLASRFYFLEREILSFVELSEKYKISINVLDDINLEHGLTRVKEINPQLILSIRFGKILKQPVIEIPKQGVINLHSGLLPNYQGVMATFWAMLNQEEYIGTCLHYISDSQIDTGEIIKQTKMPRDKDKSYLENVLNLYPQGIEDMVEAVEKISSGNTLESKPQQGEGGYYTFPTEKEIKRFLDKGFRLFD